MVVKVMMVTAEKIFEKSLSFFLKGRVISGPVAIRKLKPMDYVPFPSNNSLSMKKELFLSPNLTHFSLDF